MRNLQILNTPQDGVDKVNDPTALDSLKLSIASQLNDKLFAPDTMIALTDVDVENRKFSYNLKNATGIVLSYEGAYNENNGIVTIILEEEDIVMLPTGRGRQDNQHDPTDEQLKAWQDDPDILPPTHLNRDPVRKHADSDDNDDVLLPTGFGTKQEGR